MAREQRFRRYSTYLRERYGGKVYRVAVDAGFYCPHRMRGGGEGCSFCDQEGARAAYQRDPEGQGERYSRREGGLHPARLASIRRQIEEGTGFLRRRYGAERYILYFQAFSNTFAPLPTLRGVYDYALSCADFRELIVSTRPDCVGPGHAGLLAEYMEGGREVWVELGLQSAHEQTLRRIRRGHTVARFERAYALLKERGLKVTVHLIFGLPGEGRREIMETVRYLSAFRPDGVKIHNLHVAAGTAIAGEYMAGELSVPSSRRHLQYVAEALRYLPPDTIIQRITCDTRDEKRIAPRHLIPKGEFYSRLDRYLEETDIRQGDRLGAAAESSGAFH